MAKTKYPEKKRKYLLELLNKAHVRIKRNAAFSLDRGTDMIPIKAVENMLGVRRALSRLKNEVHRTEIGQWHSELKKVQALAQERLIGPHACPDWDFLELTPGSIEFCVCTCKPGAPVIEEEDHQAFLLYHHKTKVVPHDYSVKDMLEWYYNAGLKRGRGK